MKTPYRTRKRALSAAVMVGRKYGTPMRVFKCERCKHFHLTSAPLRA